MLEQYPNDVKLVFKNFPLTRIHKFAAKAAVASLAAEKQGKFWEYHDALFKDYNKIDDAKILEIAETLELDMTKFNEDLSSKDLEAKVSADLREGVDAGVRGTPSLFVNGRLVKQRSPQGFKSLIDDELKKLKK